ncbi:MAG: hypothetical protein PVI90_15245 [Desulfobacteraceae bacterium]|jgi:hypothetical protein
MEHQVKDNLLPIILAYVGFIFTWGFSQILDIETSGGLPAFLSLVFFLVVYVSAFGIALPFFLSIQYGYELHGSASKISRMIGIAALVGGFVIGVFFSDALPLIKANPPTTAGIIKYLLLFAPMALAICLQCFFLVPMTIKSFCNDKISAIILPVSGAVLSIGFGFWVDQLFRDFDLAMVMMMLGTFFGLGAVLTQSLYLTYFFFFPTMLINTLSEGKYTEFSWGPLIIGFVCTSAIIFNHFNRAD